VPAKESQQAKWPKYLYEFVYRTGQVGKDKRQRRKIDQAQRMQDSFPGLQRNIHVKKRTVTKYSARMPHEEEKQYDKHRNNKEHARLGKP
jgi:hypothetical protein